MKVAVFHNLPSGGAKRAACEWTRRLVTRHRVDVYTLSTADHRFCDLRPFVGLHEEYAFTPARLFSSPCGRLNQLLRWRDLGRLTQLGQMIAARIDAAGYDVVFAHPCQFTFVPTLLRFLQTPRVYFLHEPFGRGAPTRRSEVEDNADWRRKLDRVDPLLRLYARRLDKLQGDSVNDPATQFLANSRFTRSCMTRGYGLDAPLCHYGVDTGVFAPIPGVKKGPHVLSVGELSPRKGFGFLVDALGALPASLRPPMTIASNMVVASERKRVEERARERGVRLEVKTHVTTADLVREYNGAVLCVYAPHEEPFGLVPLEAMACGTAVVGVREGGVAESVVHEQTGLLTGRERGEFASAVARLLSQPSQRTEYERNAREHVVNHWSWERSVEQLELHLARVARQRS